MSLSQPLSKWRLEELKPYERENRPLFIMRDPRTGRFNKRSYFEAVKRAIKRNKPTQL